MQYNIYQVVEKTSKKSTRILTFDLLRGYFLVAIILDHLAYFPNGIDWLTGRGILYVSAAEGFFFISGIVLGIVRGRKLIDKPFAFAASLLLKRSLQLYVTAIILMLLFTFIGWGFLNNPGLKPGIINPSNDFFDLIRGAFTFEYIYGWADYLRLYAVFIFVSPIALWLLRRGLWYVVLIASALVWTQFSNSPLSTPELSQVYSWQLIFFGGFVFGFHWESIQAWWQNRSRRFRKTTIIATVTTAALTMIASYLLNVEPQATLLVQANSFLTPFFNKESLPIPRIILFLIWFGASFWLFSHFEKIIIRYFGWLLIPFGGNSLYVYVIHAFVVFFAQLLILPPTSSLIVNFALSITGVGLVWLAVHYKFLMKIIPR